VLSAIGTAPPITLARVIADVAHDKSQVGRAVRRLEEVALVERRRGPGGAIHLAPTLEGTRTRARIAAEAFRRDTHILVPLSADEHTRYVAVLDLLTVNAEALLDAERKRES